MIGIDIRVPYPFVRSSYIGLDADGTYEVPCWRPGTTVLHRREDVEMVAHGMGFMILTAVSLHKPGKWRERVFFTRKWEDPNGRVFGKNHILIKPTANFRELCKGYRHPFRVVGPEEAAE